MKNFILTIFFASMVLTGCKTNEDPSDGIDSNAMETEVMFGSDNVQEFVGNEELPSQYTSEQAQRLREAFSKSVNVEDNRATQIHGWDIYTTIDTDIDELRTLPDDKIMTSTQQLRADYNILMSTIPDYLMVKDVRGAIASVHQEISAFEKMAADSLTTRREKMESLEEIQGAYDDLAEEIARARAIYVDDKNDAMQQYLNDINTSDKRVTTLQRGSDQAQNVDEDMSTN